MLVPFLFRIVHPNVFLRNIAALRTSPARRGLFDLLGYSGLGWGGIKAIQSLRGKHRALAGVTFEIVPEFADWADDVWNQSKNHLRLSPSRSTKVNVLYPATDRRFMRLKVMRNGKVFGWAVLLNTQMSGHKHFGDMRVGTLVGCLATPEDATTWSHAPETSGSKRRRPDHLQPGQSRLGPGIEGLGFLSWALEPSLSRLAEARRPTGTASGMRRNVSPEWPDSGRSDPPMRRDWPCFTRSHPLS